MKSIFTRLFSYNLSPPSPFFIVRCLDILDDPRNQYAPMGGAKNAVVGSGNVLGQSHPLDPLSKHRSEDTQHSCPALVQLHVQLELELLSLQGLSKVSGAAKREWNNVSWQ